MTQKLNLIFLILITLIIGAPPLASASPVCSNLLAETTAGTAIFKRYEHELKKAIYPQLRKLGWNGRKYISVLNMPDTVSRVSPQYLIRIDLDNKDLDSAKGASKVILRNKTIQTSLRLDSYPLPEINACDLVLQARGDEYLVNQKNVPTKIYVPLISVRYRVRFNPKN